MAKFQLGPHTLAIPMSLHRNNRDRLIARLRADDSVPQNAVVFLQGGKESCRDDTDHEHLFRQVTCCHTIHCLSMKLYEHDCTLEEY